MELQGQIGHFLQESLSGVRAIQADRQEESRAWHFRDLNGALLRLWARSATLDLLWESWFNRLLHAAGLAVVFGAGMYESFQGRLTLGELVAFLVYVPQLYGAISMIALVNLRWQQNLAALQSTFSLIDRPSVVSEHSSALMLKRVAGHIRFEQVSFVYPTEPEREAALHEVDLSAEPGEFVALVGSSGSGKSTVVDLLLRFYDPDAGRVLLDGHDLRDLALRSVRANVALMPQEVFLFDATIRENILVGCPDADEEAVRAAARTAALDDFVRSLPKGYDTVVGERGVRLSGGERQRLGLARALVKNAPVLVLDEPTSALDGITEATIRDNLRRLARERTVIVVAHRLSTVASADRIYVLDQGRMLAIGTHESLRKTCPLYGQLYDAQVVRMDTKSTTQNGVEGAFVTDSQAMQEDMFRFP